MGLPQFARLWRLDNGTASLSHLITEMKGEKNVVPRERFLSAQVFFDYWKPQYQVLKLCSATVVPQPKSMVRYPI